MLSSITRRTWLIGLTFGPALWLIGLALWRQQGIDEALLFYFNPARVAHAPGVILAQWLTSYGMAVISGIFVSYLLVSQVIRKLDAPLTYYLYTICSLGLSGVAGDLLKELFARPRPAAVYGSALVALSQSVTPAMPSGHATKSVALILPFIVLVPGTSKTHRAIKIAISLVAGGVCLSRIVLGAHYLSDVVAGIGMGVLGLPFAMGFANLILKQTRAEQLPCLSRLWGVLLALLTLLFMAM